MLPLLLLSACAAHADRALESELVDKATDRPMRAPQEILEAAAENDDPNPRARALVALAVGASEPRPWIERGLFDPDPWVQAAMVGHLAATHATDDLVAYARRADASPEVRADALRALGDAGLASELCAATTARAGDALCLVAVDLTAASGAVDTSARDRVLGDLGQRVPFDVDYLADVGRSQLAATGDLGDAVRKVEPDEEMKIAWEAALAGLGEPGARAALVRDLRDPDDFVRLVALDAAHALPDEAAVSVLKRASGRGSPLLRHTAAVSLAVHGHGGPDALDRASRHDDAEVRRMAYRLAHDYRGPRADKVLPELAARGLLDEDPEVRTRALWLANDRGLALDGDAVKALLIDDYVDVRVEASAYLLSHP